MLSARATSVGTITQITKDSEKDYNLEAAQECKYANFWVAYDALDKNNKNLIEEGINMAKDLQKALVQIGTSIIDKKEVKAGEGFRYVFLENDYLKDVQLFQYPLALQKLALFVMETHKVSLFIIYFYRQNIKKLRISHLLWLSRIQRKVLLLLSQSWVIQENHISVESILLLILIRKYSDFGQRFRAAAEKAGARTKHDGFDTAMIEVKNEDSRPFMEELHHLND